MEAPMTGIKKVRRDSSSNFCNVTGNRNASIILDVIARSSAESSSLSLLPGMFLVYKLYRRGGRTYPWGTPLVALLLVEGWLLMFTRNRRLSKTALIRCTILKCNPTVNSWWISLSWGTLSKVFAKSEYTTWTARSRLRMLVQSFKEFSIWVTVGALLRKITFVVVHGIALKVTSDRFGKSFQIHEQKPMWY